MVLQDEYCEKCVEVYTNIWRKWCKSCQIDYLKENFTSISENEKIDILIQEMRLKIDSYVDIVFEWIPYNRFDNIKEIIKDGFPKVSSAIWKSGPLYYDKYKMTYKKNLVNRNQLVFLKCFNPQNIIEHFNKV